MSTRLPKAPVAAYYGDVSLDSKSLGSICDDDWAELLARAVYEHRRVWIGQDGVFVERAVIGRTDCLQTGIRESDGVDVLQEVVAFGALVGDELKRRRERFDCMLLDAADSYEGTISGTRFQLIFSSKLDESETPGN